MDTLHTARLVLRGFQNGDLDDFYNYAKHPEVGPNAGWTPHANRNESKKILAQMMRTGRNWAIVEKESSTVIGSISAVIDGIRVGIPGYYEIGYAMGKDWWGKGYMTEAAQGLIAYLFNDRKANLVSARRNVENLRSARVIEKCGFHLEGTLRHTFTGLRGEVKDTVFYSLLPEEYLAQVEANAKNK